MHTLYNEVADYTWMLHEKSMCIAYMFRYNIHLYLTRHSCLAFTMYTCTYLPLYSSVHHSQHTTLTHTLPLSLPSSLLPYLHMLMDPLVSALSGSQNLISQGLRTLELCVDNLQPDFLYDHIQPVRAELMQVCACVCVCVCVSLSLHPFPHS